MRDFVDALETKVLELMDLPAIEVLEFEVYPPREDHLVEAERFLKHPLPESVRAFYSRCGGLTLRWVHRERASRAYIERFDFGQNPKRFHRGSGSLLEDQREDGRILLRSLGETFLSDERFAGLIEDSLLLEPGHKGSVKLAGATYPRDAFYQQLRVFDAYSSEGGAAFFLGDPSLPVVQGSNSAASYEDGHVTDFESYLELLLASRGLKKARWLFYMRGSDKGRVLRTPPGFWTAADFDGVLRSYRWRPVVEEHRPAWEPLARVIHTSGAQPPCPDCGGLLRYERVQEVEAKLWLWCGACHQYTSVTVPFSPWRWPRASGYIQAEEGLDVANLAWARGDLGPPQDSHENE
jgi:hypothetical protein